MSIQTMYFVDVKTVYGINITRTPKTSKGGNAVFDRTLTDEQILQKLNDLVEKFKASYVARTLENIVLGMKENDKTFAEATRDLLDGDRKDEDEDWENDYAVARILAILLGEITGARFGVELSRYDGPMFDPRGIDLAENYQCYIFVAASLPWEDFTFVSKDEIDNLFKEVVRPFVYSHIHWTAEAQIGNLEVWREE